MGTTSVAKLYMPHVVLLRTKVYKCGTSYKTEAQRYIIEIGELLS
jgi:hypothetical protein